MALKIRQMSNDFGNNAQNASSGDNCTWDVSGKNSVVASIGYKDMVKSTIGTWVTLAEYKEANGIYECINVVSKKIDGIILKENVYYTLIDGVFVEIKE